MFSLLLFAGAGVHAQTSVDNSEGAAKLLSFTGQISVMRDNTAWALNVGDRVKPQQMIVTGADGWGLFEVSDGSKFEVFQNAHVVFRANRGDWRDLLEVWIGKVRVQIEHIGNLPNNNRVRTPSAVISVRGTIFDVEVEDGTDITWVLDEEGSVEVRHLLKPSSQVRVLNAGEWVRVYKNDPLAKSTIDKGGLMQKAAKMASDALYQIAAGARSGGTIARTGTTSTGTGAGDKNTGNAPPPPTAPPPPATLPPAAPAPPAPGPPK